tara:strand:- start:854 stop:1099 length:246 start_codon:yes stop_codon:yes gene_type:complete
MATLADIFDGSSGKQRLAGGSSTICAAHLWSDCDAVRSAEMNPHVRTPLKTEILWGCGTVLVMVLVTVVGFLVFMKRLYGL